MPLTSKYFVFSEIYNDCTLEDFCKEKILEIRKLNLFLELNNLNESDIPGGIGDVILMDKVRKSIMPYSCIMASG